MELDTMAFSMVEALGIDGIKVDVVAGDMVPVQVASSRTNGVIAWQHIEVNNTGVAYYCQLPEDDRWYLTALS